jgi:hypothetical protein
MGQSTVATTGCTVLAGLGAGLRGCMLGSSSGFSFGQQITCSFSMLGLDWAETFFYQFFCLERWISFYLKLNYLAYYHCFHRFRLSTFGSLWLGN